MRRIAIAAVLAVGSFSLFAIPASADPVVTVCGSAQVTVNGQDVVNQATCEVLPPQ